MYKTIEENKDLLKFNAEGVHPADMFLNARKVAIKAVDDFVAKHGEPMYCGFAWVELPEMKLSTKLGKAFQAIGFKKSWSRGLTMWDPAEHRGQSMDCKEVGAQAYAEVVRAYGIKAYMGSRAD